MVKLESVNIPSILHNVRERFKKDLFMTNIGDILVLVNPYKWIDSYYTMDVVADFAGKPLDGGDDESNEDPHIFGIAAAAYRGITIAQRQNSKRSKGQAVIISGESGSGKTEATKKCLQYLTAVADGTVQAYLDRGGGGVSSFYPPPPFPLLAYSSHLPLTSSTSPTDRRSVAAQGAAQAACKQRDLRSHAKDLVFQPNLGSPRQRKDGEEQQLVALWKVDGDPIPARRDKR